MKYGILCAMEEEIRLLEQDITGEIVHEHADRCFYEGKLYGQEVVLVRSRIGKVAAALTATLLIDRFGVDAILFGGTAGGIAKGLRAGDLVVADRLVQHDIFTGESWFCIPLLEISELPADPGLSKALLHAAERYVRDEMESDIPAAIRKEFRFDAPRAVTGTIASGDQFICDSEKHAWLAQNIANLQCVEMEGAAVAQVCYELGVPCAVVRVVSDNADDDSYVDFERFVEEAASRFTRGVLREFLRGCA